MQPHRAMLISTAPANNQRRRVSRELQHHERQPNCRHDFGAARALLRASNCMELCLVHPPHQSPSALTADAGLEPDRRSPCINEGRLRVLHPTLLALARHPLGFARCPQPNMRAWRRQQVLQALFVLRRQRRRGPAEHTLSATIHNMRQFFEVLSSSP